MTFAQQAPIRLIVPYAPGGPLDVTARALAEQVKDSLGTVIVENKPGAGGNIGSDYVAKATPDGSVIGLAAVATHAINPWLFSKMPYDAGKDFAPITQMVRVPNVLVVNARTPAKNVNELVALIKAKPAEASYGSNGNGTAQHLIGTQFQQQTGTRLQHIPYKGSGPLATDLLGGQILMSFDTITPVLPHIKAGKLRPLAVTTAKRSPALPDVPTLQEAGLKDFDIGTWFGVLAPVGTPKPVLDRLSAEATKIIQSPDFRKRMDDIGAQPVGNSPAEMAAQIRSETDKFSLLVKAGNVTVE